MSDMIEIIADGKHVVLPESFVLSFQRKSPLFFAEEQAIIPGEYSIPASIPARENKDTFDHAEFLNNWDEFKVIDDAVVKVGGNSYGKGKITLSQANKDQYDVQFLGGAGDLEIWRTKTLAQYRYTPNGATFISFPNWQTHITETQTNTDLHNHLVHPYFDYDIERDSFEKKHTISFYIKDIIKACCEEEGYRLETTFFEETEHKHLLLVSNFETSITASSITIYPKNYFPNITVANFLKELAKVFLLYIVIDSKHKVVKIGSHNDVQENFKSTVDWSSRIDGKFTKKSGLGSVRSWEYDYGDDPLMGGRGVGVLQKKLRGSISSFMFLPEPSNDGDWVFLVTDQRYYRKENGVWQTAPEDAYRIFPNQEQYKKSSGDEGVQIKSKCLPVWMWVDFDAVHAPNFAKVEVDTGPGSFLTVESEVDYFYIGIYKGLTTSTKGVEFPFITVNEFRVNGTANLNWISLDWHGSRGLFETYWIKWIKSLYLMVLVDAEMELDYNDLFNYEPQQTYEFWDDHSGSFSQFLFKSFKVVVNRSKIQRTTQQLVKVRSIPADR